MSNISNNGDYSKRLNEIMSKRKINLKDLKEVLNHAKDKDKAKLIFEAFSNGDTIVKNGKLGPKEQKGIKNIHNLWEATFGLFVEQGPDPEPAKAKQELSNDVAKTEVAKTNGGEQNSEPVKYTKDVSPKTQSRLGSKKAFNDTMQRMAEKYDKDKLSSYFDTKNTVEIRAGSTLYKIAEDALNEDGLPTDWKSINKRISQIAKLNNIKDVNNVKIGQKLVYKLTSGAKNINNIQDVLENNQEPVVNKNVEEQKPVQREGKDSKGKAQAKEGKTTTPVVASSSVVEASKITVTPNAPERDGGTSVDKDGNEVTEGAVAKKYTVNGKDVYQVVKGNVRIEFDTLEDANKFFELSSQHGYISLDFKESPSESEEVKKARQEKNIKDVRDFLKISKGNVGALIMVAESLDFVDADLLDQTSDVYKSLVQDLLKTRNPEVIKEMLLCDDDTTISTKVLDNDPEAHKIVAGLFKEIRDAEKQGVKLTDEQIKLKDTLDYFIAVSGALVEDMGENSKLGNIKMTMDGDGNVVYTTTKKTNSGNSEYYNLIQARDKELLESFMKDYEEAMNIPETLSEEEKNANKVDRKTALHNLYVKYSDSNVHKNDVSFVVTMLAMSSDNLGATAKEIINVINDKNNGLDALAWFDGQINNFDHLSEEERVQVYNALAERELDIYTNTDKGNLENLTVLDEVFDHIDKITLTEAEKKKEDGTQLTDEELENALNAKKERYKNQILESYFEVTTKKDEEGNDVKEYKFNPSRRLTYEEAKKLAKNTTDDMRRTAIIADITQNDLGTGRAAQAIVEVLNAEYKDINYYILKSYDPYEDLRNKYASLVQDMNSFDEIYNFIAGNSLIVTTSHDMTCSPSLPNDAIIAKIEGLDEAGGYIYTEEEQQKIKLMLAERASRNSSIISDENRIKLAKAYIDGNGEKNDYRLARIMPVDCKNGDAKDLFVKILKSDPEHFSYFLNFSNYDFKDKEVRQALLDKLKASKNGSSSDNEFLDAYSHNYNNMNNDEKNLFLQFAPYAAVKNLTLSHEDLVYIAENGRADVVPKYVSSLNSKTDNNGKHLRMNNDKQSKYIVNTGDSIDKIVKNYLRHNLDKFPRLKESVDNNSTKWTNDRITEALDDYLKDFRGVILQELGITDAKSIQVGSIIDLDQVKWTEHQPGWWNYNFLY